MHNVVRGWRRRIGSLHTYHLRNATTSILHHLPSNGSKGKHVFPWHRTPQQICVTLLLVALGEKSTPTTWLILFSNYLAVGTAGSRCSHHSLGAPAGILSRNVHHVCCGETPLLGRTSEIAHEKVWMVACCEPYAHFDSSSSIGANYVSKPYSLRSWYYWEEVLRHIINSKSMTT